LTAVGAKVTGPRQLQFDHALDAVLPPIALSSSSAPMRSPAMPMTRRPGLAICAPIAAGRPKPGGHHHDADLPGRARIALGRMSRALLVADEIMLDVALLEDFVIDRQYGCAGIAEDMFDTVSQSAWRTISPPFIGVSEELL
jgi:hypothetical protein